MDRRGSGQSSGVGAASPRKHQSFPTCVTDVLEQVTKVCGQQGQKWRGPAALRNNELQYQLDNDLFCISPDRRVSRLNQIQQLRLMQILCDYFKERESEPRGQQYSYFEAIFCGREGESFLHETRITLLINLCSLAVQYPCYSVLNHISQWLHKIGSGKSYAQQFVSQLVDHYIFIADDSNLHKYLLPLADEVPEFVSYFVAYSVTKDSLRQSLFMVLNHWLTGRRSDLIMAFIKETPVVAKHFASVTFPYMVVHDCCVGGIYKNPLHGFTTMLYADWKISPSLELRPALEILSETADYSVFDRNILCYHVHLAKLSHVLTQKDLMDILDNPKSSLYFKSLKDELLEIFGFQEFEILIKVFPEISANMSVMFANSRSNQANNGYLVEFKAGRSNLQAGSTVDRRKVVADKTKGLVFIKQSSDQLMHFCWKNRETGAVVDDLIIFPGDTEFLRVKECTDGRVYMLKFKSTDEKRLFWMQDGKTDKDDENCKKVNETLNNPPAPRAAARGGADRADVSSFGTLAALGSAGAESELGALGNLDQSQLMQLLSLMNHTNSASASEATNLLPQLPLVADTSHPMTSEDSGTTSTHGATPSNTPANGIVADSSSNNAVQLSQLKEIIASITPPDGSGRKPSIDFTDVLCCADKINDVLRKYAEQLIPHLPSQEPIYNNQEELQQTLRTPQFRQAADIFGHALQTGQLAPVLRQFGIDGNTATAAGNGDMVAWAAQFTTAENGKEITAKTETSPSQPGMESDVEDEETNEKAIRETEKNRTDDHMDLD